MMSQSPNLFLSVGKQVKDEYGRTIGRVASFAVTPSGRFDTAFVEQGNGEFTQHSVEHLKFDGAEITLISKTKSDAYVLCDHIPLIWRKDQALEELSRKKKLSPELYNELHKSFDGALAQLKTEAQVLSKKIDEEIGRCAEEINALNHALIHLEIEHEIGKIDDKYYETAFTMIQDSLRRTSEEKSDLETTKNKLSNTLLGDKPEIFDKTASKARESPKGFTTVYSSPGLPEPPVVVYVKEIGKTGI
jgi:hypothetical protein